MIQAPDNQDPEYALLQGKVHLALGDYKQAHIWLTEYSKNSLATDPLVQEELLQMLNEVALYQEQKSVSVSLGKLKGAVNSVIQNMLRYLHQMADICISVPSETVILVRENIFLSLQQIMYSVRQLK